MSEFLTHNLKQAYYRMRRPHFMTLEPKIDFTDWGSEARKAIYGKFSEPMTIGDCTPDFFEIQEEATVGNPNPKTRTVVKKP